MGVHFGMKLCFLRHTCKNLTGSGYHYYIHPSLSQSLGVQLYIELTLSICLTALFGGTICPVIMSNTNETFWIFFIDHENVTCYFHSNIITFEKEFMHIFNIMGYALGVDKWRWLLVPNSMFYLEKHWKCQHGIMQNSRPTFLAFPLWGTLLYGLNVISVCRPKSSIYKFDHVYPGTRNKNVVAVLYGELGKPGFTELHEKLKSLSKQKEVTYLLRHFVKVKKLLWHIGSDKLQKVYHWGWVCLEHK